MSYNIYIKKQAKKALQLLPHKERNRITEKIVCLGRNPNDTSLDIKVLEGQACFRLRVGGWRVIFDKEDRLKIISIEKIKARGDAYK